MRLIDSDQLRDYLLQRHPDDFFYNRQFTAEDIVRMLEQQETAYPTKTSEWIRIDDSYTRWKCKKCYTVYRYRSEHCPKCGAEMKNGNYINQGTEVKSDGDQVCSGDPVEDQHGEGIAHSIKQWLLSR